MIKKTIIPVLLSFLLANFSCTKERGTLTQVRGKVLEYGSGIPVENALVKFVHLTLSPLNTIETIIDTVRTDKNGNYSFKNDTEGGDLQLLVYSEAEGYFSHQIHAQDIGDPDANVIRGINQYVDISIKPFAWVKIKAKNTLGNDYAWINRNAGSNSAFGFHIQEGLVKIRRIFGNQEVGVNSFLTKNNLETGRRTYLVNTTAGDTTEVIIHY